MKRLAHKPLTEKERQVLDEQIKGMWGYWCAVCGPNPIWPHVTGIHSDYTFRLQPADEPAHIESIRRQLLALRDNLWRHNITDREFYALSLEVIQQL